MKKLQLQGEFETWMAPYLKVHSLSKFLTTSLLQCNPMCSKTWLAWSNSGHPNSLPEDSGGWSTLIYFNFEPSLKLGWCRFRDCFSIHMGKISIGQIMRFIVCSYLWEGIDRSSSPYAYSLAVREVAEIIIFDLALLDITNNFRFCLDFGLMPWTGYLVGV